MINTLLVTCVNGTPFSYRNRTPHFYDLKKINNQNSPRSSEPPVRGGEMSKFFIAIRQMGIEGIQISAAPPLIGQERSRNMPRSLQQ